MAVVNTPNLISGRIGGLIYYVRDGKQCVRSMPVHDKKKHATAPTMEPVRRHNAEFSASSRAGAVFRTALGSWRKTFADGTFNGKVTSIMFGIVSNAEGEKGRRPLAIRAHGHLFNRLPLHQQRRFAASADQLVSRDAAHQVANVSLTLAGLRSGALPAAATHFRWVTLAFAVPDFEYSTKSKQYEPTAEAPAPLEQVGEWQTVSAASAWDLSFSLTAECGHFLALGLEFAQSSEGTYQVLRDDSLMEIITLSPSQAPAKRQAPIAAKKVETVAAPVEAPVVQLKKVQEVPAELVLPENKESLDLDFDPSRLETALVSQPEVEVAVVEEAPAALVAEATAEETVAVVETPVVETVASPLELPKVETEDLPPVSEVAETVASVEDAAQVKPKRERKPRAPKPEEEAPKAKVEKAKADTGQLSLFF
jgi:hypothetical protein